MVDPVGVGGEGVDQGAFVGVPYFDGSVVGGGVDVSESAPAYAFKFLVNIFRKKRMIYIFMHK